MPPALGLACPIHPVLMRMLFDGPGYYADRLFKPLWNLGYISAISIILLVPSLPQLLAFLRHRFPVQVTLVCRNNPPDADPEDAWHQGRERNLRTYQMAIPDGKFDPEVRECGRGLEGELK